MIPYSKAALALAPSVSIPDSVFLVFTESNLFVRDPTSALLIVWNRFLWDWNQPSRQQLKQWLDVLKPEQFYFLRTKEGSSDWCECLGHWQDNPFALDYLGVIDFVARGLPVAWQRMAPHPDRLVRTFEHGKQEIRRCGTRDFSRGSSRSHVVRRHDISTRS